MTTGTKGRNPANPLTIESTSWNTWNGADGKYESFSGGVREKWNNFTSFGISAACTRPTFTLYSIKNSPPFLGQLSKDEVAVVWNNGYHVISISGNLANKTLASLLAKVKGHEFNLGVETGQAHQTVSLLAGNLGKLGRAALALRRGDFATAARQLGASPRSTRLKPSDISGRWLELQYGWLPLLSSSFEACQAFEEISNGPRKVIFQVRGKEHVNVELSTAIGTYSLKADAFQRRQIKYEMYEEMSIPRQLGLYDPLSIAWELTPWSFVVDWFVPFGTYLSNLNQIPVLKGRWLVTDTFSAKKQSVTPKWLNYNYWGPSWTIYDTIPPAFSWGVTRVSRSFSGSPPAVPLPNFKFGLNSSRRFWNAVSLAHQRFKR